MAAPIPKLPEGQQWRRGYEKPFMPSAPLTLEMLTEQMEHNTIRGWRSPTGRCECPACRRTRMLLVNAVGGSLKIDRTDAGKAGRGRGQGKAGLTDRQLRRHGGAD